MEKDKKDKMQKFFNDDMQSGIWYPLHANLTDYQKQVITGLLGDGIIHFCIFNSQNNKVMKLSEAQKEEMCENMLKRVIKMEFNTWYNVKTYQERDILMYCFNYSAELEFNYNYTKVRKVFQLTNN
jgi:hypothetical protein